MAWWIVRFNRNRRFRSQDRAGVTNSGPLLANVFYMPQPDNIMAIFLSANTIMLLGLAVVLGRYLQRVDSAERAIQTIQNGKVDVAMATLATQVSFLSAAVADMQKQMQRISDYLMIQHPKQQHSENGD